MGELSYTPESLLVLIEKRFEELKINQDPVYLRRMINSLAFMSYSRIELSKILYEQFAKLAKLAHTSDIMQVIFSCYVNHKSKHRYVFEKSFDYFTKRLITRGGNGELGLNQKHIVSL